MIPSTKYVELSEPPKQGPQLWPRTCLQYFAAGCILLSSIDVSWANTCVDVAERAPVRAVCGRIFNPIGEPVQSAEVSLVNESGATLYIATIGKAGSFSFGALPKGDYTLRATAPGYVPEQRKISVTRGQNQNCKPKIEVKLGLTACGGSTFVKGFDKKKY